MARQDQERVEVSVAGVDLGVFDTFSGGEADSDDTKHRPGGMGESESLGGFRERGNFTVGRLYRLERDHGQAKFLDGQVGRGEVVAKRIMLDRDKVPVGDPITFTGTLKTFNHPEHDSNSADPKMVTLEVTADGPIS
jgi:hypothetical protein